MIYLKAHVTDLNTVSLFKTLISSVCLRTWFQLFLSSPLLFATISVALHATVPLFHVPALPSMVFPRLSHLFINTPLNSTIHSSLKTVPRLWIWRQSLPPSLLPICGTYIHSVTLVCLFTCMHVTQLHTETSLRAETVF